MAKALSEQRLTEIRRSAGFACTLDLLSHIEAQAAECAAMRAIVDMVARPGAGVYYDGQQMCVHCDGERQTGGFVHSDSCLVSLARRLKGTAGQALLDKVARLETFVAAVTSVDTVDVAFARHISTALRAADYLKESV